MVIEQAFFNLPEILVGAGYAHQDYEAGIVSAFSLAILQELNGRNAPNPISCLCAEKKFSDKVDNLRADLHINLSKLYSGSRGYSEFGFRFSNWVEAKFFRLGKGNPPSTQNLGAVVADILRLVALVPIEANQNKLSITGRYFLHAYWGDPLVHLNPNKKKKGGGKRDWVSKLLEPGFQEITDFGLSDETKGFFTHLGKGFETAKCSLALTNFKIEPRNPKKKHFYTVVLSRIESAEFTFNGRICSFKTDRTFQCIPDGEFDDLRTDVAKTLKPKKASEEDTGNDMNGDNEADE